MRSIRVPHLKINGSIGAWWQRLAYERRVCARLCLYDYVPVWASMHWQSLRVRACTHVLPNTKHHLMGSKTPFPFLSIQFTPTKLQFVEIYVLMWVVKYLRIRGTKVNICHFEWRFVRLCNCLPFGVYGLKQMPSRLCSSLLGQICHHCDTYLIT